MPDVDRSVLDLLQNLVAEIAVDADLHRRVEAVILRENFRQNVQACRFVGAEGEHSSRRGGLVGHGAQGFGAHVHHAHGVFKKGFSRGGKPHGLASAVKQLLAVFLFELAHLRADGRLRAEQFLPGARKTAKFCNFNESSELVEIHI